LASKFRTLWPLESLINELLVRPKFPEMLGRNPQIDTSKFDGIRRAYNHLYKLEDAEYGIICSPATVFDEMARIGHRQFPWQRGYYHNLDLARSAYLFGGPHVAEYFSEQHGLKVADFVMAGFAIFSGLMSRPFMESASDIPEIGLTQDVFSRAVSMLALPIDESRERAAEMRMVQAQTAYRPSILRPWPCILFDGASRVRAPLPALVLARVTDGVYYDVVAAGGDVTREIGQRFEEYCFELLKSHFAEGAWRPEGSYGSGQRRTPDIRLFEGGECNLVVECKAKRMTFAAKFGAAPLEEAAQGFSEISKGVFQIWRYASHVRRGLISGDVLASNVVGMVLTLDPWAQMSRQQAAAIMSEAHKLAEEDGGILHADRLPVAILSISDVEHVAMYATLPSFLEAVRLGATTERAGWMLYSLYDLVTSDRLPLKENPFKGRIGEFLPWWDQIKERSGGTTGS
jgi:hypothetical protein